MYIIFSILVIGIVLSYDFAERTFMEKDNKQNMSEVSFGISRHEDAVLKKSMQFFAGELLLYFGIEGKTFGGIVKK